VRPFGLVLIALVVAGCGATATASPTASPRASASPTSSPVATSTPVVASAIQDLPSIAIQEQCSVTFGSGGPTATALGSVTPGAPNTPPPIALLDITNPLAPRQICTYNGLPRQVRLIGTTELGYAASLSDGNPAGGLIGTLDVPRGADRTIISWKNGGFGAGTFAWSSDGALAYILATPGTETLSGAGSWELHLMRGGDDRILTTLPGVPGRGGSQDCLLYTSPSPRD